MAVINKTLRNAIINHFATKDAANEASIKLRDAVKAAGIKGKTARATLYPVLMECAAAHYGVPVVTPEKGRSAGKETLDTTHKSYEAAKKAITRALFDALGTKGKKTSASTSPAKAITTYVKTKGWEKSDIRAAIKALQAML